MSLYRSGLSPQAVLIYRTILRKGVSSVNEIATELSLKPQGIYRILDHLENIGLIERLRGRPKKYRARTLSGGLNFFLLNQRSWFLEKLNLEEIARGSNLLKRETRTDISVILGRDELLEKYNQDLKVSKDSVNLIVIGLSLGIPSETLYQEVAAVRRGVVIRELVQEVTPKNREMLLRWIKNGIDVKQTRPLGFHLILIDDVISYVGIFDTRDRVKRTAVRFQSKAINLELQSVFQKYWRNAKTID